MNSRHDKTTPRRRVTLLTGMLTLAIVLLAANAAWAVSRWSDIADSTWVSTYGITVDQAASVASGYDDGTFRPGLAVSRGQIAKMVVDGLGYATANPVTPTFSDVPPSNYFYPWIEGGHDAGLISGYDDGTYRPAGPIIRVGANKVLGLALSDREMETTGHIQGEAGTYVSLGQWYAVEGPALLAEFADGNMVVTPEYKQTTAYLVFHGVVQGAVRGGQTYLDPLATLKRAQAVALIVRVRGVVFNAGTPTVTSLAPAVGAASGNTTVVITGTGFVGLAGAAAVRFGTTNADELRGGLAHPDHGPLARRRRRDHRRRHRHQPRRYERRQREQRLLLRRPHGDPALADRG